MSQHLTIVERKKKNPFYTEETTNRPGLRVGRHLPRPVKLRREKWRRMGKRDQKQIVVFLVITSK